MSPSRSSGHGGLPGELREKLAAMRRRMVRVEVTRRLAVTLSLAILGVALLAGVDWVVELPLGVRTTALVVLGVVVSALVLWTLVALITSRRDDEALSFLVEQSEPGFRSRLIAAVQFAEGKASVHDEVGRSMVERLVEDTREMAKAVSFSAIVSAGGMKRAALVLLLLGGLAGGGYWAGGSMARDLVRRAFLAEIPVPRATRVIWTTGDVKVGIGDTLRLEAEVEGFRPAGGTLRVHHDSGRRQRLSLQPVDGAPARYAATLENVQESFTYQVILHDGRSARSEVRALPRPAVLEVTGRQSYPEFTNLSPTDHRPGEFLLFPGSELALTIKASQPLRRGSVRLLGAGGTIEGVVDPDDRSVMRVTLQAPEDGMTGFSVELLDSEEMASRDATVYRVDILSDESPLVRIVKPTRQRELVTATARVLVGYEIEDRYGVKDAALHFRVAGGATSSLPLPDPGPGKLRVEESYEWDLATLVPPVEVGDEVEFWVEANDQNTRTAPGRSAVRSVLVVTPQEKRDDLLSRVGDHLARVDQTADQQERLNAVLADWIRAQAPLGGQDNEPSSDE